MADPAAPATNRFSNYDTSGVTTAETNADTAATTAETSQSITDNLKLMLAKQEVSERAQFVVSNSTTDHNCAKDILRSIKDA